MSDLTDGTDTKTTLEAAIQAAEQAQEEELPDPDFPSAEYIGGPAGTGKTHLVRERASRHKGMVLAATTGIAAVNLGEGVTTINSLLGYFDTASLRDAWSQGYLENKLMRLVRQGGLRHITLDEVSMLDADALSIITLAVRGANERLETHGVRLGLTLTGDFCQLPPVKAEFAFTSDFWPAYEEHAQVLSTFYRQTDPQFLAALQDARRGEGRRAVEYFEQYFQVQQDLDYPGLTILAKNDEVDRVNAFRLTKLPGVPFTWRSLRWGKPKGEWKLIPEELRMKPGALVMLLSNEREYDDDGQPGPMVYANGDLAEVLDDDGRVRLRRNGQEVMVTPVTRNNLEVPTPARAKELRAGGKRLICGNLGCKTCRDGLRECKDGKYEVVGSITYMPLRLAYAVTVHKSQGLTLEEVQMDFRDRFWTNPGMLYVGLSRVRSPEGLRLVGTPEQFVKRCAVDEQVRRWL